MAKAKIPELRADRVYGHAATDRMHQRDKLSADAPAGGKTRQSLTNPPARAKQQRKSPRSGAAAGASGRHLRRGKIG